jgi:hypothetical protein
VGLAEALVAVAITAIAITGLLSALSTGSLAVRRIDRRVTAENVARAQLEYTKAQPYIIAPASYAIISPLPDGYSVTAAGSALAGRDDDIQKVTVTVIHNGETAVVLEDYKVNR